MKPTVPDKIVLLLLGALLLFGWALIIWIATVVTQSQLSTLHYIVELAQMP